MLPSSANTSHHTAPTGDARHTSATPLAPDLLVSDKERIIFQWVMYAAIISFISSFGTATNIINIICFVRQGLKDPVNVSLLGLAISDLGCLVTSLGFVVGYHPALAYLNLPVEIPDFQYLTFGWPHIVFTGSTSWLTAFITLERCLCITVPLKVKHIITPKRATIIITCVFILLICSVSPIYSVSSLVGVFSSEKNRTVLRMVHTENRFIVEQIAFALNNAFIPFSASVTITISTVILVVKLREKTMWRKTCAMPTSTDTISERDQKVTKMVTVVSALFIVCFTPLCVTFIVMYVLPELAFDGPNRNMLYILAGISMLLESTNSSANIFIYYHMSSRYRAVFRKLFRCADANDELQPRDS